MHTDNENHPKTSAQLGGMRAVLALACFVLLGILLSVPSGAAEVAAQEVSNVAVFSKEIDGRLYIYAPTSYAVRSLPTYSQWRMWNEDKPKAIEIIDGRSIVTCICCGIKMDVTNDLSWTKTSQHTIKVGTKVKLPEEERTGDNEFTITMRSRLVMRQGAACESCWKEYIRIEDEVNAENRRRTELNEGRRRLKELLEMQLQMQRPVADAPLQLECLKHPSMRGFCACLTAERERRKASPIDNRITIDNEKVQQLPLLSAFIDVKDDVKRMEVQRRDDTTWQAWALERSNAEASNQ